jgi:hypothetical protein
MHKPISRYLAFLLLFTLSLHACQKAPEPGPEPEPREGAWTKVHYRAAVSGSAETKATLDAIDRHYLFERDDLLYVVDSGTGGDKLYGFLFLISGAGATEAVFEGDLMYFVETAPSSGTYEPERPSDGLAVSATLVSQTQRDAGVYTIETNNDGKIASGPNFGDHYAATFKDAVRKYSTFTAEATYGDPSFHLVQGTAFLLFTLSFEDNVTATLTATVTNNDGAEDLFSRSFTPNPSTHDANFVAAFPGGTITLHNARMRVTDGGSFDKAKNLSEATLQGNRYYNVSKNFLNLEYFTIQAKEATTISFPTEYQKPAYGLQYSTDEGANWKAVSAYPDVNLAIGESIILRGKGNTYQNANGTGPSLFTSTAACYIYGDIMSLFCTVDGDVYTKKTAFSGTNDFALNGTFRGMTNLDIHPARPLYLSATTLSNNCYQRMFYGCTGLTRAPEFFNEEGAFAADIPQSACKEMFLGCTALSAAPDLPANGSIEEQGYCGMFIDCTSLTTPPTRLAVSPSSGTKHFQQMFQNCSALLYAPELPATTVLASGCQQMFENCSSLLEGPELPAVTVGQYAYYQMFKGCSSMTQGPSELPATVMYDRCYASMFLSCALLEAAPRIDAETLAQYCFQAMFSECHVLRTVQNAFAFNGSVPKEACSQMFFNCLALQDAPQMPSINTTIEDSGCKQMYSGCGELRTAPSLNATTVKTNGYYLMFYRCARLVDSPAIAATNVGANGCQEMFRECTRLQTPPATLPATTLGNSAYYQMFHSCSKLESAPSLPAMNVPTTAYYQMFYNCTSLVTPPSSLPATTLGNKAYQQMFYNCSKLASVPNFPCDPDASYTLPAGSDKSSLCYQMFFRCYGLTTLEGKKLFNSSTSMSAFCFEDMFSECRNLDSVPTDFLPATSVAASCYRGMFQSTKITRTPDLPASTLASECYRYMFNGCSQLTYIKCLATTNIGSGYTTNWVGNNGTGGNVPNTNSCKFERAGETNWPDGVNGKLSNWVYYTPTP